MAAHQFPPVGGSVCTAQRKIRQVFALVWMGTSCTYA